jgi:lipopolysaccharide/colanic/teichoic acid biosynthesis glycosyltransferase
MSLALACATPPRTAYRCKEALDRILAVAFLLLMSPLLLVITALVAASSPGPVMQRRRVVGRNGVEFDAFKFRTMVADADAILQRARSCCARSATT